MTLDRHHTLYVQWQRQEFSFGGGGCIVQGFWGTEAPKWVSGVKPWRRSGDKTQKLKQFADIIYRF